jgi:formate dehydrogenase maturation protein FdhE
MQALDSLLEVAAAEAEWTRVVQRCAWCGRVADEHGQYVVAVAVDADTVFTDGMCPACAARALASLAERRARRQAHGALLGRPAALAA